MHPASVTNAVDRLEHDKLVMRVAHPTDGRMTLARITPKGRRLVAKASSALNTEVFEHPGLSRSRTRALTTLLAAVRQHSDGLDVD